MFHIGHLNIIERAKECCDYLIVGVTTDELCYKRKKKMPIIKQEERLRIIQAIRYVDKAVYQEDMNKAEIIRKYNVDVVFVGSDWKGTTTWDQYEKEFAEFGCSVVYLDYTEGISSTVLREKLNEQEY